MIKQDIHGSDHTDRSSIWWMNVHAAQVEKLILENWCVTIRDLFSALELSIESIHIWCQMQEPYFQHERISELVPVWDKYINVRGDCGEKLSPSVT
jgi:hypothetical protein